MHTRLTRRGAVKALAALPALAPALAAAPAPDPPADAPRRSRREVRRFRLAGLLQDEHDHADLRAVDLQLIEWDNGYWFIEVGDDGEGSAEGFWWLRPGDPAGAAFGALIEAAAASDATR